MKLFLVCDAANNIGYTPVQVDMSLAKQSPTRAMDALLEKAETAPREWLMDREFRSYLDAEVIRSPDVTIGVSKLSEAEASYKDISITIWDEPLFGGHRAAWATPEEITLRTLGDERPWEVPERYRAAASELTTAGFFVGVFRDAGGALYYGCRAPDDPDMVVDMQLLSMSATPVHIMMEELFSLEEARAQEHVP